MLKKSCYIIFFAEEETRWTKCKYYDRREQYESNIIETLFWGTYMDQHL